MASSSDDPPQAQISTGTVCTLLHLINSIPDLLQQVANATNAIPPPLPATSSSGVHENHDKLREEVKTVYRDLNAVKDALEKLKTFEDSLDGQFGTLKEQSKVLDRIVITFQQNPNGSFPEQDIQKVRLLSEILLKMKLKIQLTHKLFKNSDAHRPVIANEIAAYNVIDGMPVLHKDDNMFEETWTFKDLRDNYGKLDLPYKLCLLCFAVFHENVLLKKRLLINWWVGEGFLDGLVNENMTVEEIGKKILDVFVDKNFIQSVTKKGNISVGYRMHSLIHSSLIILAKEAGFFDFDKMGIPTAKLPGSCRVCLVKTKDHYSRNNLTPESDPEYLRTIFNVNDPYPDFKFEWFSKMKNVKVLHLGGWQDSAKHHIEVEDTDFLRGLTSMKYLKLFSLQGISRITKLPNSICQLSNLRILDLNKCHNLESLPDKIDSLKKLTHLDISECYLLDHMPKGLASLLELQVLKGFIISDLKGKNPCAISDLAALKKLRKLIISTNRKDFPAQDEITALSSFQVLQKLTIAWGGKSLHEKADNSPKKENTQVPQIHKRLQRTNAMRRNPVSSTSFAKLKKLDLQCFPGTAAPDWLKPGELKTLEKLYIRGGKLCKLSEVDDNTGHWHVKTLRLKFLSEFDISWKVLQNSFPYLNYLEKVSCPKLAFFPCDHSGVWQKRTVTTEQKEL